MVLLIQNSGEDMTLALNFDTRQVELKIAPGPTGFVGLRELNPKVSRNLTAEKFVQAQLGNFECERLHKQCENCERCSQNCERSKIEDH